MRAFDEVAKVVIEPSSGVLAIVGLEGANGILEFLGSRVRTCISEVLKASTDALISADGLKGADFQLDDLLKGRFIERELDRVGVGGNRFADEAGMVGLASFEAAINGEDVRHLRSGLAKGLEEDPQDRGHAFAAEHVSLLGCAVGAAWGSFGNEQLIAWNEVMRASTLRPKIFVVQALPNGLPVMPVYMGDVLDRIALADYDHLTGQANPPASGH